MLPPIRCFTCGNVIADKYDYYVREVQKLQNKEDEAKLAAHGGAPRAAKAPEAAAGMPRAGLRHFDGALTGQIMDKLGLKRYCCRRMMLGTEDMMDVI